MRTNPSPVRYVPVNIAARAMNASADYVTKLCRRGEVVHRVWPGSRKRRRYAVAVDAQGWPIEAPLAVA